MDEVPFKELLERGRLLLKDDEWAVSEELWWLYFHAPMTNSSETPIDVLLELPPELGAPAATRLRERFGTRRFELVHRYEYMAVKLTLDDFLRKLLPLTTWQGLLLEGRAASVSQLTSAHSAYKSIAGQPRAAHRHGAMRLGWLVAFLGHLLQRDDDVDTDPPASTTTANIRRVKALLDDMDLPPTVEPPQWLLHSVAHNRRASMTIHRSRCTVKADAACRVFEIDASPITWAVLDSGIDARHLAFRMRDPRSNDLYRQPFASAAPLNRTRIDRAFDFTAAREPREPRAADDVDILDVPMSQRPPPAIPLTTGQYEPPRNGHGTHVAGIIGGDDGNSVRGVCPDLRFWDLRVLDANGEGDEFAILSALRFVLEENRKQRGNRRHRNENLKVHGINLSLSLVANVTRQACGWTLVCQLCDELVASGVVVVVSAGNTGFDDPSGQLQSTGREYRTLSITDPGNADRVITVGSTHPDRPFEYGVSYFSARGPTADGRIKPDLVAPGQAIESAFISESTSPRSHEETRVLDGTSQAAAHVSGVAALLMARHRELIGRPEEVKRILCSSATDLGRERVFQGAGLVDALRALQSY